MSKLGKHMTIKEAANYLGVCRHTLRKWGARGRIKERRDPLSGYRLYTKAELDRFLKKVQRSAN